MPHRRLPRTVSLLRHAVAWVVAPLAVWTVVYLGMWQRYERSQAAAERLPTAVAAQLARLPPPVAALVAITFTAVASDPHPSRAALEAHLRSTAALTVAPTLRIRASVFGARAVSISFAPSPLRAGCAAVLFGQAAAVRVVYGRTRAGACAAAERRLRQRAGGDR